MDDDVFQDAKVLRLWYNSPRGAEDYDMTGDALVPGSADENGDKWILGKEIRIPPANMASKLVYRVGCQYQARMKEQQSEYHMFMRPTIGATVFLKKCPGELEVNVFPR